jgi:hypothetical protein
MPTDWTPLGAQFTLGVGGSRPSAGGSVGASIGSGTLTGFGDSSLTTRARAAIAAAQAGQSLEVIEAAYRGPSSVPLNPLNFAPPPPPPVAPPPPVVEPVMRVPGQPAPLPEVLPEVLVTAGRVLTPVLSVIGGLAGMMFPTTTAARNLDELRTGSSGVFPQPWLVPGPAEEPWLVPDPAGRPGEGADGSDGSNQPLAVSEEITVSSERENAGPGAFEVGLASFALPAITSTRSRIADAPPAPTGELATFAGSVIAPQSQSQPQRPAPVMPLPSIDAFLPFATAGQAPPSGGPNAPRLPTAQRPPTVPPRAAIPSPGSGPTLPFQNTFQALCPPCKKDDGGSSKPKRKKREPRVDCTRGTYEQTSVGVRYNPKETFPCP